MPIFIRPSTCSRSQAPPGNALHTRLCLAEVSQTAFAVVGATGGRASGTVRSQAEPGSEKLSSVTRLAVAQEGDQLFRMAVAIGAAIAVMAVVLVVHLTITVGAAVGMT